MGAHGHDGGHLPTGGDAARGENRNLAVRAGRFDHLGDQHQCRDLPAVAACLGSGNDQDVDAGLGVLDGVFTGSAQRCHRNAFALAPLEHERRWHTQRVGHQLDGMREGGVEDDGRTLFAHVVADTGARLFHVQVVRGYVVLR